MKNFVIIFAMSLMTTFAFGQKERIQCQIWTTESFCDLPASVNVPARINYSDTTINYGEQCESLDKQNFVGVWVTFQGKDTKELNFTSQYRNISLIRKQSKEVLHPVAYMERSNPHSDGKFPVFLTNKSTFGKCTYELKPNEKYDLFILFEAAEVGDKLVIEDFLEAEIK